MLMYSVVWQTGFAFFHKDSDTWQTGFSKNVFLMRREVKICRSQRSEHPFAAITAPISGIYFTYIEINKTSVI